MIDNKGTDVHEVIIQNTTFGGTQGFTKEPDTPWYDDDGNFAGIVRQERGWSFVLVAGAGHEVPEYQPEAVSPDPSYKSFRSIYSNST